MHCQFLCNKHRALLSDRLAATSPIWSSWMRQGDACRARSDDDQSIQYFGCALDLSILLIERYTAHGELDGQRHIERLMASGLALSAALARCGHLALRRTCLNQIGEIHYREQLRTPLMAERLPPWDSQNLLVLDGYLRRGQASGAGGQSGGEHHSVSIN